MSVRIKRFNEDLGFDVDANIDYNINGYIIKGIGIDGGDPGYVRRPGHTSFTGTQRKAKDASKWDSPEEAQEYLDELETKVKNPEFIKASDLLTASYIIIKSSKMSTYDSFLIKSTVFDKADLKDVLYDENNHRPRNDIIFEYFKDAKQYVINNLTNKINKHKANLEDIHKFEEYEVKPHYDNQWLTK